MWEQSHDNILVNYINGGAHMAEDEKYQKLLKYLTPRSLCWIIHDLLTQRELQVILNKSGIKYGGREFSSIPSSVVVEDLAQLFFKKSDFGNFMTRTFLKKRLKEKSKLTKLDLPAIKDYTGDCKNIFNQNRVGKVLWVILTDERPDVNDYGLEFIQHVENIIRSLEKKEVRKVKKVSRPKQEAVKPKDDTLYREQIKKLEEKLKSQDNTLNQLSDVNKKFRKDTTNLNQRIELLQKEKQKIFEELEDAKKALFDQEMLFKDKKRLEKESKELRETLNNQHDIYSSLILLQRKNLQLRGDLIRAEIKYKKVQRRIIPESHEEIQTATDNPRVGVFVDVQNIYYGAKIGYQAKLNFETLLNLVTKDREIVTAIAYIVQTPEINQDEFIKTLDRVGYTVKSKDLRRRADGSAKGDWDLGIAMDIISLQDRLDVVVLVSGDGDFTELIKVLKRSNITVEVAAFQHNTSRDLIEIADTFYPMEEDMIII